MIADPSITTLTDVELQVLTHLIHDAWLPKRYTLEWIGELVRQSYARARQGGASNDGWPNRFLEHLSAGFRKDKALNTPRYAVRPKHAFETLLEIVANPSKRWVLNASPKSGGSFFFAGADVDWSAAPALWRERELGSFSNLRQYLVNHYRENRFPDDIDAESFISRLSTTEGQTVGLCRCLIFGSMKRHRIMGSSALQALTPDLDKGTQRLILAIIRDWGIAAFSQNMAAVTDLELVPGERGRGIGLRLLLAAIQNVKNHFVDSDTVVFDAAAADHVLAAAPPVPGDPTPQDLAQRWPSVLLELQPERYIDLRGEMRIVDSRFLPEDYSAILARFASTGSIDA